MTKSQRPTSERQQDWALDRLKPPFPWFGGKRRVANLVWGRFGNTPNYVEPFAGGLAVLLGRPHIPRIETVNDKDGFIANFWRALKYDPDGLAKQCNWPVNEVDLRARHSWLATRRKSLTSKLLHDPDYYHVKIAGWWVWGLSMWIGSGWCDSLSNKRPDLGGGRGVHSKITTANLEQYFQYLFNRLRNVRVCCGDWERVLGPTPTEHLGTTAVFFDPPYGNERESHLYAVDDTQLFLKVRDWSIEHGNNSKLRIALCGYVTEIDDMPDGWERVMWKSSGYNTQAKRETNATKNITKECIWFSPHCVKPRMGLLGRPL